MERAVERAVEGAVEEVNIYLPGSSVVTEEDEVLDTVDVEHSLIVRSALEFL